MMKNTDPIFHLADALKSPDSDAPRRAIANCVGISEQQSQLIQIQCDIAAQTASDPFRNEWQLIDHLQSRLLARFIVLKRGFLQLNPNLYVSFRRGFLEVVTTDIPTFLECGSECLNPIVLPFVNRLHLTGVTTRVDEFAKDQLLSRFQHIWFGEAMCNDQTVKTFVSSPFIKQLKSLNLRFWGECDDKNLLASFGGVISAEGANALANSVNLSGLKELDVTFHNFRSEGVRVLADSPQLRFLETLILDLNDIGDEGLKAISSGASLSALKSLSVRNNRISLGGMDGFLSSTLAESLRCLRVSDNTLRSDFGLVISEKNRMASLERLYISNCGLGGSGFSELLNFKGVQRLQSLNVDNNAIGDDFFKVFGLAHYLRHISAAGNNISDLRLPSIEGASYQLRSLNLHDNQLGDKFARSLSESMAFGELESLNLSANQIGDEGSSSIRQSGNLRNLRIISLDKSKLSTHEQEQLVRKFGDGVIFT